jgi:hypothetical protein
LWSGVCCSLICHFTLPGRFLRLAAAPATKKRLLNKNHDKADYKQRKYYAEYHTETGAKTEKVLKRH